jgi:hypothetical protein
MVERSMLRGPDVMGIYIYISGRHSSSAPEVRSALGVELR